VTTALDELADEKARQLYQLIVNFGWDISWKHDKPVPDDAWPIDLIRAALVDFVVDNSNI